MNKINESYNKTKKRTLEVLEDQKWLDVPTIARKVGIRPIRRAYTYLVHLQKISLVRQGRAENGRIYYQITQLGLERLAWLRTTPATKPTPLEGFAKQLLQTVGRSD
jgi:hypothetical protein